MHLTLFDVGHELRWLAQARGKGPDRLELMLTKFEENFEAAVDDASGKEFLDPAIPPSDKGGYVFLWEDVFVLDELITSVGAALQEPEQAATLVVHLFHIWQRLRTVRVPLDKPAYRVLAAVKAGHATVKNIAEKTNFSEEDVDAILQKLASTEYEGKSGRLPLARHGEGGWFTPF